MAIARDKQQQVPISPQSQPVSNTHFSNKIQEEKKIFTF
jgi:hypothetical protein